MEEALGPTPEPQRGGELAATSKVNVSRARWYCLAVCSAIAALQGGYWNNFGPIAAPVKPLFGWNDATIALLSNWGPICYILMVVPSTRLLDVKGIKLSCLVAAVLVFVGSVCRVPNTSGDEASGYLMHAGQFFNGLAGCVAMMVGPVLSATWFPPSERTTATAAVSVLNYGGTAATFVVGPMLVRTGTQSTSTANELRTYMVGQAGLAALLLAACLFLPSKPPFPPSRSAQVTRDTMLVGFAELRQRKAFWAIAVCYGVITGFSGAWGSMLGPNMENVLPESVAEQDAGYMGFWGAIAACCAGLGMGAYADSASMAGRKKGLLMVCCAGGTVCYTLFACLCSGILNPPYTLAALYATSITSALFAQASVPLFYEMAVEETYPIAEGLTTGVLTLLNNIGCLVFLAAQNIPGIGTSWMNWACVGACALPLVVLARVSEHRRRLEFDTAD